MDVVLTMADDPICEPSKGNLLPVSQMTNVARNLLRR